MHSPPFRLLLYSGILFCLCVLQYPARATHIVGGEVTYKYLGDTIITGFGVLNKYAITLTIYEDCLNGSPAAIASDNPAFVALYDGNNNFIHYDSIDYSSSIPVPANFSNACVTNIPQVCLLKKTFNIKYYLPPNTTGYIFSYQRCCRNDALLNVQTPGTIGATYYCVITPTLTVGHNNSAVFNNYPPQIICNNTPLTYNHSATDADGDSLSYELCNSIQADDDNIATNAPPAPPPYANVQYVSPPYSYSYPMTAYPVLQIDAKTGIITGTPNRVGRYLVTICCSEWRHGVMINTIRREFQFVVTNCTKAVVADIPVSIQPNIYELDCANRSVNFINTSKGGNTWNWYFGVQSAPVDTAFEPTFLYPDTGTYTVKLVVNPNTTCEDSIIRLVEVYPILYASFSDSGSLCQRSPVGFMDQTESTVQPITFRKWFFGDGDSSSLQNPVHSFLKPGTYNTILVTQNAKSCADTALRQVVIEDFTPFAGNDTIIVKGEKIQFNATGGEGYAWSPGTNLNDTGISDPLGYYPDTGKFTYSVYVISAFGCQGYDTIQVTVVNQAEFFVPSAFSPNGDGRNDIFKPIAVGYSGLNYFMVYNRWGQVVYNNNSLDGGWDGYYDNRQADLGTYFWEISFTDRFGKKGFLKGDVTLLR